MRVAIPIFKDLHLLRKDMLEALADYAFQTDQLLYKGYGDGIVAGCDLTTTEDSIILNEGVIFFAGQMFLIKEPMSVFYHPTNTTTILKICFSEQMRDENLIYREIDLALTEQTQLKEGELELCRFKLQEGARLRYQYQNFEDRNTEFDTLNTIYAPYSAKGGSTLSPKIVYEFASDMLKAKELSALDMMFGLQLLDRDRPVGKDVLAAYIEKRDEKVLQNPSNLVIYQELARILKEITEGRKAERDAPQRKKWRMMVD